MAFYAINKQTQKRHSWLNYGCLSVISDDKILQAKNVWQWEWKAFTKSINHTSQWEREKKSTESLESWAQTQTIAKLCFEWFSQSSSNGTIERTVLF